MPTYQYLCRDCDDRFDTVQSIHDEALTVCPECGGTVRRVLHPVGVTFKGSGFYRTDSRDTKDKKASKAPAGKEAAATGGSKDTASTTSGESSGNGGGSGSAGTSTADSAGSKAAPAGKTGGPSTKKS